MASDVADLLNAIASILWVAVGIAVIVLLWKLLTQRAGSLSKFGVGPTGVTMEFAEAKIDQAVQGADAATKRTIGRVARRAVVDRLQRNADLLARARILWVDDHPENNTPVIELLRSYGATIDTPRSNGDALALLSGSRYDVVASDVARDNEGPGSELKGVELAEQVYRRWNQPTVLFTARFDPTTLPGMSAEERLELVSRLQGPVFGRTNRMDEALHLIMDLIER